MSCFRFCLLPPLLGSLFLLTGALSTPSPPAASLPPPVSVDPAAAQVFDQALARVAPQRLTWVEMNLWQQVNVQNLCYQAEGRYLAGPDHRLRLDLQIRVGDTDGWLQVICDGALLWQCRQIGAGPPIHSKIDLQAVLALVNTPGTAPQLRAEFLQDQSFGGVGPLLYGLREQVTWTRKETVRRYGRTLVRLTGSWNADPAPTGAPWPPGLPRQARLYLDPATLWPHRLEWWGPDPPRSADALLVQMEFRDPVLNCPPPAERCTAAFSVPGNGYNIPDRTSEVAARLQDRARQLARPGG
jgi:hypothetical protein